MESRKEAEISNALFDMLDDPFNAKLPDLAVVNLYKLAKDRRIWLDIAVDDNTLEWEKQILLWNMEDRGVHAAQRKPIWIYLFNYGGSFDMEWSFIDLIDASTTPIYTVNMGVCASAAADIFIAGKKRFMTKNARTMLHQGSAGFQGDSQKLFDQVDDYKRQLERTKQFILERTQISSRAYGAHLKDDWWLNAEECLKHGVCDQLIESIEDVL